MGAEERIELFACFGEALCIDEIQAGENRVNDMQWHSVK